MNQNRNREASRSLGRALLVGVMCTILVAAQAEEMYAVEEMTDVVYGIGPIVLHPGVSSTKALSLDIYRPKGYDAPATMAIIVVHGGAFSGGRPRDMAGIARYFAERGFVCFSIGYRLTGDLQTAETQHGLKAACTDARAAIRWVRAHAKDFDIDPSKIGIIGHSAGAITALEVGISTPADLLCDGPVIAPANHPEQTSVVQAAAAIAGLVFHPEFADTKDPPLLWLHGTHDPVIPLDRVETSLAQCKAAGATCQLLLSKGAGHDPWNERYEGSDLRVPIVAFFREALGKARGPLPEPDSVVIASAAGRQDRPAAAWDAESESSSNSFDSAAMFTLDVSGTRHGSVILDPPGGNYPAGAVVKLTAVADPHYVFLAWAGNTREVHAPASVTMTSHRSISAVFVPAPDAPRHALSLKEVSGGRIIPSVQWATHIEDTPISLTALPDPGFRFAEWTGALGGSRNPCTLVMDREKSVGACFERVLSVEPLTVILSAEQEEKTVLITAAEGTWRVAPFFVRPWLEIDTTDERICVTGKRNTSCYPRTALLRITSSEAGVEGILMTVSQQGTPRARPKTLLRKGLATYNGSPGETGTLQWWVVNASAPRLGLLEANAHGGFTIGCYRGTALGFLTTDGATPLTIPDGNDYHIYATWDLPEDPEELMDPESGEAIPAYLYVGIDSGEMDGSKLRFGIEWKDIGAGKEWVVRAQRDAHEFSALKMNGGPKPIHVSVHVWKDSDGDTVLRPGAAIVRAQFKFDGGPWQDYRFLDNRMPEYFPIAGIGFDGGEDRITFKTRGLGTKNLREIRVEGMDVPGVNHPAVLAQ